MAILSALDLFGIQPALTIDNNQKFKSLQGFLITAIAIAMTIASALTPVNNWLYKLNPLIVQEAKLNTGSTFIGGIQNPLYFGIRCLDISRMDNFSNLGGMNIISNRIPQPKVTNIIVKDGLLNKSVDINLDKCEGESTADYLLGFEISTSLYCLNDEIELYDRNNGGESSRLIIQYDREMFNKIFYGDNPFFEKSCGVSVIYQNTYLDASNFQNFIQFDVSSEELMTRPSPELLFQTLTFKKLTYKKKMPVFSEAPYDERIYSTLDRSYTRALVNPPTFLVGSVPIMLLTLEFSKKEEIFNLKYFEFQDLISTIGGTFGIITSLLRVFSAELNKFPMKAKIINSIFKFYKRENGELKEIKKMEVEIKKESNELPELAKRRSVLKETIINNSSKKIKDEISIFDLYKIKFKLLCKRKLSNREEFIILMEDFVINSSNIENISKLSYIVTQLSNVVIGPSFAKYVGPPELNLDNGDMKFFELNKEILFKNEADFKEIKNIDRIFEDVEINENIKDYIMKKYEESNR
jgi:hypothetical protein